MKEINGYPMNPLTYVAAFFTAVSLAWTGYSITDLMEAGAWGLLAAVSVDGLWGVVQYLDAKGIGGRAVQVAGWITLAAACGLLGYHGWTINPAAAVAGALPPIVAKLSWIGDIRLRRDPAALAPDQEAEINDVIRESEYIARKTAAEIDRETAAEIARIQAQGKVAIVRTEVIFDVQLARLNKQAELDLRRPLELEPAAASAPVLAAPDTRHDDRQEAANTARQEDPVTEWAVDSTETEYPIAPTVPAAGSAFGFGAVLTASTTRQEAAPAPASTGRQEAASSARQQPAKRAARKPASTAAKTRRPMTEWVELAAPVLHAETERLGRQPSGPEFADAIAAAGLGAVSASTAKNIRAGITG
ncbi:hypothetical protein OG982_06165 [Streptomyces sp. NBC_01551]|uniref:hypothetical protein n=1 Tax=Streptomyces sp. NBC_01551 TaxID=2975876 RepID=UPI00225B7A42|nr:hypothetical protein [Streptomyces sp. NBC_01551]MCX4525278.1 hypothetical protein [Streptomyces sp. NBC_01551]